MRRCFLEERAGEKPFSKTTQRKEIDMALPVRVSRGQMSNPLDVVHQEFDSMLGRLLSGRDFFGDGGTIAPLGVDIREDANHICVEADLPGFKKEEIDVSLE